MASASPENAEKCLPLFTVALATSYLTAQRFAFPGAATGNPSALSKAMPILAMAVLASYKEDDRLKYLDGLFRLQMVAGQYNESGKTLASLRMLRSEETAQSRATNVQYEIYAAAKALQSASRRPFEEVFRQAFHNRLAQLDDRTSAMVIRELSASLPSMQKDLESSLQQQKSKENISLADAITLLHRYQVEEAYREMIPLVAPLIATDDEHRYVIDANIKVRTPDGATICTAVIRPRQAEERLPALLNFSIYTGPTISLDEARRSASNGYVGVQGLTRGKGCSPDKPVPFEYDGSDVAALIDWIGAQPWCDGRVGMFGGSYTGFTQWAAAKHMPKALKAMMPSVTGAPGIDTPMEGGVHQSFNYYWPFYASNGHADDEAAINDRARWSKLNHDWYVSGRAYRDLDKIDGTPNPIWDRWLDHPSYDAYWQNMIPYREEFSKIDIPVLTTTGYYDGGQIGALYYLTEHYHYDPKAEHYLVVGPYDHVRGQRGTVSSLGDPLTVLDGYETDPAAQIDLGELRYQWFNYIFKDASKPAILKDKINYEVMGANEWKHAPSLAAMGKRRLTFHLSAAKSSLPGGMYRLNKQPVPGNSVIPSSLISRTIAMPIASRPAAGISSIRTSIPGMAWLL